MLNEPKRVQPFFSMVSCKVADDSIGYIVDQRAVRFLTRVVLIMETVTSSDVNTDAVTLQHVDSLDKPELFQNLSSLHGESTSAGLIML